MMSTKSNINISISSSQGMNHIITDGMSLADRPSDSLLDPNTFSESVTITDTVDQTLVDTVTNTLVLIGCSAGTEDHGGTEIWDGWRCYNKGERDTYADRTGGSTPTPKFIAYSQEDANLGGATPSYNTVFNSVLADLNNFYYTNSTDQIPTARADIKLYWSNGHDSHNKGALTLPHTEQKINNFIISQRALYDAVHYIDPLTGGRRFPNAYAGSNPTHQAELAGEVASWLNPSAPWHDFVMWSMFPPGRESTLSDPTFNWPSFYGSQWNTDPHGFLVRCFRRTKIAETYAGHPIEITCGEIGIGDDPDDSTTRPYYIVHGLMRGVRTLSQQYNLRMPFLCWWDEMHEENGETVLSAEPVGTSPSSREALQNYSQYDHTIGGTHPGSWAGNPKSAWKTTGTVV